VTRFVRNTIVGGVLFLVPIIVLLAILGKAHALASRIVKPLAERIPYESMIGLSTPRLFAILLIVIFCFLAGLFAKTVLARRMISGLEDSVLSKLPGYTLMKGMAESIAGADQGGGQQVVLAWIEESWQIGLLMDRIEPGHVAVFLPGTPDPRSGSVYYLTNDRIKLMDMPLRSALDLVRNAGKGSSRIMGGKLAGPVSETQAKGDA
jgi:uncharacterized membrane protein